MDESILRSRTVRVSDAQWREFGKSAQRHACRGTADYVRAVVGGEIPSKWAEVRGFADENSGKSVSNPGKNLGKEQAQILIACALESNMLLRKLVKEYVDEGEDVVDSIRNALPELLKRYGVDVEEE